MTSLGVRCSEGFNGGLMQSFMLEIRDSSSQDVRNNVSSPVPRFAVANLHPGGIYSLSVFAFNSKGRSDPAMLQAAMLRMPEKQLTAEKGKKFYSLEQCRSFNSDIYFCLSQHRTS
jgi:immunoglobulin superfamily member 9B